MEELSDLLAQSWRVSVLSQANPVVVIDSDEDDDLQSVLHPPPVVVVAAPPPPPPTPPVKRASDGLESERELRQKREEQLSQAALTMAEEQYTKQLLDEESRRRQLQESAPDNIKVLWASTRYPIYVGMNTATNTRGVYASTAITTVYRLLVKFDTRLPVHKWTLREHADFNRLFYQGEHGEGEPKEELRKVLEKKERYMAAAGEPVRVPGGPSVASMGARTMPRFVVDPTDEHGDLHVEFPLPRGIPEPGYAFFLANEPSGTDTPSAQYKAARSTLSVILELYSLRPIRRHEEITWCYGPFYRRDGYKPSSKCK